MSFQNVSRAHPCEICGSVTNYCSFHDELGIVVCRKECDPTKNPVSLTDKTGAPYWKYYLKGLPARGDEPQEPTVKYFYERADATTLNAVYQKLLSYLTLTAGHMLELQKRGYGRSEIEEIGFKSWPSDPKLHKKLSHALVREFRETLLQVPGFWGEYMEYCPKCAKMLDACSKTLGCSVKSMQYPHLVREGFEGYVLPIRDLDGRIVALQLRLDVAMERGGKYMPVSSTQESSCGGGLVVHCPALDMGTLARDEVWLVEGVHKAEIATRKLGKLALGLPSVSTTNLALPIIEELRPGRVVIAMDADARTNPSVAAAVRAGAHALASQGQTLALASWTAELGKGIDDVIQAGHRDKVELLEGVQVWRWISDVCRAAKAPVDLVTEARVKVFDLPARCASDASVAFRKDIIDGVARLPSDTPECMKFMQAMKEALPNRFTAWSQEVSKAQKKLSREQRESKAKARGRIVLERGDHTELAERLVEAMTTDYDYFDHDVKKRLIVPVKPVFADGNMYVFDRETGVWTPEGRDTMSVRVQAMAGSLVAGERALLVNHGTCEGTIGLACARQSKKDFFASAARGIAFKNGFVVVTDTGEIEVMGASPKNKVRFVHPFDYTPGLVPKKFLAMLNRMFRKHEDREERIKLIQEFFGIVRLGLAPKYQVVLVFYGPLSRDGKSTVAQILVASMPDGSVSFILPHAMGERFQLANLPGKHLNVVDEIPTKPLDSANIFKQAVTAQVDLQAEKKGKDPFSFRPVAGHLFVGNHLMVADDYTDGFFRRFLVIEFDDPFTDDDDVKGLAESIIKEELAEIVSWSIEGAARVIKAAGYTIPKSSVLVQDEWKLRADPVRAFVHEMCEEVTEKAQFTKLDELYAAFMPFAESRGHKRMAQNKFGERLKKYKVRSSEANGYRLRLRDVGTTRGIVSEPGMCVMSDEEYAAIQEILDLDFPPDEAPAPAPRWDAPCMVH